jgi:Outer membrane protein beta-barrel domain
LKLIFKPDKTKTIMKIITKLVLLCLITMSSFSLKAQLSVGGRVGINIATVSINSEGLEISPSSIIGLTVAVPVNIAITEKFSVQPELAFIQKGFEIEFDFLGNTVKGSQSINYLDLPILAMYSFVKTETITVYLAGGPVFGYAMSGETTSEENGQKTTEKVDWETAQYNRFEVGASIGAGVGFGVGPGQVVLDIRYVIGLSNLNSESTGGTDKVTNMGTGISVGYIVPIGG